MLKKVTPENVIYIIRLSVAICCCWPRPFNSTKNQIFAFKVLQISTIISAFMVFLPLLYSIYLHNDNIIHVFKCICLSIGITQLIVQTLICFIKHNSLQRVVEEMVNCVKQAQQSEIEIFYKYIEKCKIFYGSSIAFSYLAATAFMLGPAILPISFPLEAEYPFHVNESLITIIIYMHQSLVSYQCSANVCVSIFGALLLWFTVARFECLIEEFQKCSNIDMMIACIKKQLQLKRYAEEIINCFRYIVLYGIAVTTFALILCGIILLMNIPLIVKIQFVIICITIMTEVYMYAWPADYVKNMSINISRSVYELSWYEQTIEMQKNFLNVLVYQKPVIFSISCIVPELSLRYYCSYLSNVFSIFTTLRVLLEDTSA
ncbi:uncharacterized protein LOC102655285 isoform X2 [Apis mellifera]|uniref:Odorant receptor n=1 Tax=Apis mellifera TaxID=7460 RepID=A0A7M7MK33_APIME|nr:uncharacterized protein LOC102655285 isoform X2 [Apis mellifera]|eukprot:XP_026294838.1 uncharacterized protein LOC102655285 isoform X2 [Apis mellifera]